METVKILLYEIFIGLGFLAFGFFLRYNLITKLIAITWLGFSFFLFYKEIDPSIHYTDISLFETNSSIATCMSFIVIIGCSIYGYQTAKRIKIQKRESI